MTKFVTMVMVLAFAVVFNTAALADGWKFGNWEPPTKPILKTVSMNAADWGTTAVAPAVPASCRGTVRVEFDWQPMRPATFSGRGGGWFPGKWIMANRQARAQARDARAQVRMGSADLAPLHVIGHS